MIKKIFLCLTILFSLCINVCAEDISYDFSQSRINNTGKFAIVKYEGGLYFSGEDEYVEVPLEKGSTITLLRWDSYKNIRPISEPADYTLYEISYVYDGVMVGTSYGFKECEIKTPSHLEKNGYRIKWTVTEKNDYKLIAQAEYELIDYKVSFVADGQEVSCPTYNINNQIVTEPAVPRKDGYIGKWESYTLTYGDKVVNAVYTPIEYTVTFESENDVIKKTFNVENMNVEEPQLPEKAGYTVRWEDYTLSLNNITVKAIYEVNEYEVNFVAEGENVATKTYTVANMDVTEPTVPEKAGYTGKWESYELNLSDITVNAVYTPVEYKVTFKAENFTETIIFTIENMNVTEPELPEKTGHTGKWEEYTLGLADLTVKAVYTPNVYTVTFDCAEEEIEVTYGEKYPALPVPENNDETEYFVGWYFGEMIVSEGNRIEITEDVCLVAKWAKKPVYKVTYKNYYEDGTSMNADIIEGENAVAPAEPTKTGYKFVKWQTVTGDDYDFSSPVTENIELYSVWEAVEYTVTFMAEGVFVAEEKYTIENKTVDAPLVPEKSGYNAKWEDFVLNLEDLTVNAIYTPVVYHVYFMDENGQNTVATVDYTIENRNIIEPEVPDKMGYTGKWQEYSLDIGDVTVYPQYTIINYKVTFMADGNVVATENYTITNNQVQEPAVPQKTGYTGEWPVYDLSYNDCVIKAIYTPIEYTVTFMADEAVVYQEKYTIENIGVHAPSVPEKIGYTAKWATFDLNLEDITVNAIYTPIEYTIAFIADGKEISVQKYNIENMNISKPEIPAKEGYTAKWEDYSLDLTNKNVKAIYTPIEYVATFIADGVIVSQQEFSAENMQLDEPEIPAKAGYTAKWQSYTLKFEDITIDAVYEVEEYTIVFVAEGNIVSTKTFNVENTSITEPQVPQKEWYDGRWEAYTLEMADMTVNAIYTLATYTISFVADGVEIGTQTYNKNNQTVSFPAIPAKADHRAMWEKYEIVPGGMTINVRYISKETDEENAIEKLRYTSMIEHFKKHNFTGNERKVVENVQKVGESILEDIEYGIIITDEHIKEKYGDIIRESKKIYQNITNQNRFKAEVMRLFKNDAETYEYFEAFANKYL